MVDIMEVLSATNRGRQFIEWRDEDGVPIGHVHVRAITEDMLDYWYSFFGTANIEQCSGSCMLSLRKVMVNPNWTKSMICCPQNGCKCARVYYVRGKWACKTCHGLVSIVQRLDKVERLIVKRDALRATLNSVRLTRRNEARLELGLRDLGAIERFLFDQGVAEPREQLRFRSTGTWLEPDVLPVSKIEPGTIGYGWEPGDRIGLRGLYPQIEQARVPADAAVAPGTISQRGEGWNNRIAAAKRATAAKSGQEQPREEAPKRKVPMVAPYIGTPTDRGWLDW